LVEGEGAFSPASEADASERRVWPTDQVATWREKLFASMMRNAESAARFF
jgi:hypothetical protein